jgi:hypothetical protein
MHPAIEATMNNKSLRIFLAGASWLALVACSHAEPALLGHKGLAGQTLDADGVKAVLLGKKVTLGGARIVIIIAKTSDVQDQFLQQTVGMTTSQFQNHWRRLFMTGGGSAPKIVETDADACKLAAETAGGVAMADKAKADELVVLAIGK